VHPSERRSRISYWAEEDVAFNLEGLGVFHRVRRMTTKKVVSISGNNRVHPQQKSWLREKMKVVIVKMVKMMNCHAS